MLTAQVTDLLKTLHAPATFSEVGLTVYSPPSGEAIATLSSDTKQGLDAKVQFAAAVQKEWQATPRTRRAALINQLCTLIEQHKETLARLLVIDAGRTFTEANAEVDGSITVLKKSATEAPLADMGTITRTKERTPVGVVGLITSFNFPLVVANWTLGPALMAGNAVIWKPSEKTPLIALGYLGLIRQVLPAGLVDVVIGSKEIGEALVQHELIDMVSATGSVGMGKGIEKTLAQKKNNSAAPILELGGNNAVIISDKNKPEMLARAAGALVNSTLVSSGQRCTNTRRLIVQHSVYAAFLEELKKHFLEFSAIINPLEFEGAQDNGYGPLVDEDAYQRFTHALDTAKKEGATIHGGKRTHLQDYPNAFYVTPAIAEMKSQSGICLEETFAPLVYVIPYDTIEEAIELANAPGNAGLVNGIYTQSAKEAELFTQLNRSGHSVINTPKGTSTPAHGMGFGGAKSSGTGEILGLDPEVPFTRSTAKRIARDTSVTLELP